MQQFSLHWHLAHLYFFKGIHFNISDSWRITEDNFIGIFLVSVSTLLWVISYFGLYNLTNDSEFRQKNEDFDNKQTYNGPPYGKEKLWSTGDILQYHHIVLLLSAEAFLVSQYCQMELEINLIAVELFKWPMSQLGILTGAVVGVSAAILFLLQKKFMSSALNIFFLYVVGLVLLALMESLILFSTTTIIQDRKILQNVIISIALFCNIIQGFGSTVYCQWLLFSITPSHSSSIVESHRYVIARVLAAVAIFTASYVYDVLRHNSQ